MEQRRDSISCAAHRQATELPPCRAAASVPLAQPPVQRGAVVIVQERVRVGRQVPELVPTAAVEQVECGRADGVTLGAAWPDRGQLRVRLSPRKLSEETA
jgi:hypothetical protein